MPVLSIVFGAALIGLGCFGYFGAEEAQRSFTAWIPAFVGGPMVVCGLLAMRVQLRKHAMHAAAGIALLGALAAGGRGLPKIGALSSDDPDVNKRAIGMVLAMFAICLVFVVLCVKSFIGARNRSAE